MNLNKVFIIGRVTADPQLRTTPGGTSVTSFSLATNRMWTDKSGAKQNETEFHNLVAWGRTAEVAAQYLKKGSEAYIEGRLQTRSWQDKQGQSRKSTEIVVERLQLGARPMGGGGTVQQGGSAAGNSSNAASMPEEIPIVNLDEEGGSEIKESDLPF